MAAQPTGDGYLSQHSLYSLGLLAISVNVLLMLVKITVGILGQSYALVADGIESASDIFSSLISWAGFHLSLKPADAKHPYGHGKIEALAGLFAGLSLLAAAGIIAYHAILEIVTPHHAPAWFTLPVLLLVVAVKTSLSKRIISAGKHLDSNAIKGDGWHHASDAITSGAAAIGISIALIGGKGFEMADDWAALMACVIVVINGLLIMRNALDDVLDAKVSENIHACIVEKAESVKGVENIEKCRVRKSGISFFVEIHVRVDPSLTVHEGHKIGHDVKKTLLAGNLKIQDVMIHIEPAENSSPDGKYKEQQFL